MPGPCGSSGGGCWRSSPRTWPTPTRRASSRREEAKAAQACRFTMTDDGHGRTHGRFTLPTAQAAMLKKYLLALAAPKHVAATQGPGVERRPGPERMGRALCELIERITAKNLPKVGGTDATIVVTIYLDTLTGNAERAGI